MKNALEKGFIAFGLTSLLGAGALHYKMISTNGETDPLKKRLNEITMEDFLAQEDKLRIPVKDIAGDKKEEYLTRLQVYESFCKDKQFVEEAHRYQRNQTASEFHHLQNKPKG